MNNRTFFFLFFNIYSVLCLAQQNNYSQKKEYGYNGPIKKVSTYTVSIIGATIPADTLNYDSKSVMTFNKKGDILTNDRLYVLREQQFSYKATYSGSGKNISYKETAKVTGKAPKETHFLYDWDNDFSYKIVAKDTINSIETTIALNKDYSIEKATVSGKDYHSEEHLTYTKNNKNQIEEIITTSSITQNNETTTEKHQQVSKSFDIYDNPTVIYYYEKKGNRIPSMIFFRYYEYY